MTKYKLNNTVRSSSEVTLTSYMGSTDSERKDDRYYQMDSRDNDQSESTRNCHSCPDSCEFLQEPVKIAASLEKRYDKYSLNELKVENLGNACLCEKYNGGCKLCPRPSLAPTLTLGMDGPLKDSCHDCQGACSSPNPIGNGPYPHYPTTPKKSTWKRDAVRRLKACCSKKTLLRRIPILAWLPHYTFRSGLADIIAGITVGLTVIPQAIAYAGVAGLPPQYGLYSSFMACFVYTVFGSVKDSAIGPTAIAAILTRENLHGLGPEFAVLLAFLSGCVELVMGILQLVGNGPYPHYPTTPKKSTWKRDAVRRLKACCSKKTLLRRIPILAWLPHYTFRSGLADIIAGITVGLTVIPQAIAYAGVAGLPPQYGLYSSFMACFVYTVFGSVKDSAIGPTAIAAILTRENLHGLGPEFAVLLAFLSGCVELVMGILQLGFLIDFISGPVSVGFTSAAAIIIATTQVKDILGLSFPGGKFLQVWTGMYEHIGETRLWDTVLGVSCILVLLILRKVKDIKIGTKDVSEGESRTSRMKAALSQALWFLSTTRNILVVLVCAALAYYFDTQNQQPFLLTGEVKAGLPQISPPPFSATVGNHTYSFTEMASTLGSAIFVVPLLSILENIALAKVFSEGKYVDATQEMVALGVCNIASSLVESMPVSGALSRGAVNHASGVASPAGGLYTGALVLLALQYFTPYFFYIPKASLAAVIIAAVVFMMELHVFKPIWRTKKVDIIPAVVTFGACLVTRLELGIVLGIAVNLLFLLYASARPAVRVTTAVSEGGVRYAVATIDRALAFPAAEFVRRALRKAAGDAPLVLDAHHVQAADFTAAKGIKSLIEDFHARGQTIIFYNVKPSIAEVFRGVKPREFVHCSCRAELERLLLEAQRRAKVAAW